MLERDIEARLVERVRGAGGIAYKFTSPGRRNVPDRLCVFPEGLAVFVECKASGCRPTAGQVREHQRLVGLGQVVLVVDSVGAVDQLVDAYARAPI